MHIVEIAQVKPGMVLAEPANDLLGNSLFIKGTTLSEDKIKTLKAWGVKSVVIDKIVKIENNGNSKKIHAGGRRRKTTQILRLSVAKKTTSSSTKVISDKNLIEGKKERIEHMFENYRENKLMMKIKEIAISQLPEGR